MTTPYKTIDLTTWPRRELFEFYKTFASPCFNITVKVDARNIFEYAKKQDESFFLLCLYAITRAANGVPQMRQRVLGDKIIEFEKIAAMTPIMTQEEMFRQIWCEYEPDFTGFKADVEPKIALAKNGKPAPLEDHGDDFLCASCLPWLHFESGTQADYTFSQAVPILAWGKMKDDLIPISMKCNHCFLDGLHVSRFFEKVEQGFSDPESLYR